MKSIEELSDRVELQDLSTAYSYAIDFRRWDDLDDVFTPDATLDFTATPNGRRVSARRQQKGYLHGL